MDEAPRAKAARKRKYETGVLNEPAGDVRASLRNAPVRNCDMDVLLLKEKSLYENENSIIVRKAQHEYVPISKATKKQLKTATKEVCRRVLLEDKGELSPFVQVARNIVDMPSPYDIPSNFEVSVGGTKIFVRKIILALHDGDLFIVKIAAGPTHAQAVANLIGQMYAYGLARQNIFNFASDGTYEMPSTRRTRSIGKKNHRYAPDYGILSKYPFRNGIPLLRGVLIAEVEVFNRDEGALISRLSEYATIPQNQYLLGIKIYKDEGQIIHRAAIAVLWKRNNNNSTSKYDAIEILNFGLNPAKSEEVKRWTAIQTSTLEKLPIPLGSTRRRPSRWTTTAAVTHTPPSINSVSNGAVILQISDQDMVAGGVEDSAGINVVPIQQGIRIDLGDILRASDGYIG